MNKTTNTSTIQADAASAAGASKTSAGELPPIGRIAVVGLGYVGLPLSLQFARSGVSVTGLDIDLSKVDTLNRGESFIDHIASEDVAAIRKAEMFEASTDFSLVSQVDAVVICVPTPLSKNREPDISYVIRTADAIAPHLQKGVLVVLESTTYPGTTDTELREALESGSSLKAGEDFHLAFSPEREDPGNPDSKVASIPKVIGGFSPACLDRAIQLYSNAITTLVPVSSCRAAEATKLLENIFRSVNIALVNELKVVYDAMDIDVWEVIEAAKTKPFGFMAFYPGPGLGGHCIPIDPFYLTWKAREYNQNTRFIELAGEVNTAMPEHVVRRVAKALNAHRKPLNGSKVLIEGLAYKPNVDDDRESPSYVLMELLQQAGAEVSYHDPYVPVIRMTREHPQWAGTKSVAWDQETIAGFDLVLIATAHACVDYQELAKWAPCIVDTRNAMNGIETADGQVSKA